MIFVRYLLFPIAVLYGWITDFRNFLYDKGVLKSYSFDIPIIAVGNLSVGGTGKSPQIEYLIRLLSDNYKIATLSRGYKRKSEGFILANETSNAAVLGDEPFQFYKKFPNIQVAVDADRKNGIEQLFSLKDKPDVILLDDAFQHRKVEAGFYILLTAYNDFFYNDFLLPTGMLREGRKGVKRADMIIVTKCPKDLSEIAQEEIRTKLGGKQSVFFTFIDYDNAIFSDRGMLDLSTIRKSKKIVVAGIAKPKPFYDFMQADDFNTITFSDHHEFSDADIETIKNKAKNNIIITTEKDFVRLNDKLQTNNLYYLPIKSSFISEQDKFDTTILNYVGTITKNR